MRRMLILLSILLLIVLIFAFVLVRRANQPYYLTLKPTTIMEDAPKTELSILQIGKSKYSFPQFVYSLYLYAKDKRLKGIYLNLSDFAFNWNQTYELREVLKRFKEEGKRIVCYAHAYSTKSYFLATVCDEIYMPRSGFLDIKGFAMEIWYFREMFDSLGIEPQFIKYEEYKSAIEPFINREPSEYDVEQRTRLLELYMEEFKKALTQRGVENPQALMDEKGILTSKEALENGLVDGFKYESELEEYLREVFQKAKKKTFKIRKDRGFTRKKIVVVSAEGAITTKDTYNPVHNTLTIGYGLANFLKKLRKDKNVVAVVLRVNSPGGLALTSDVIANEVRKLSEEKLVIVSMGNVAASGGYYISAYASRIHATPLTITGSIGVIGGKLALEGMLRRKFHINPYVFKMGRFSDIYTTRKLETSSLERLEELIRTIYEDFLNVVSEGRNMDKDSVRNIAKGRIWIGKDALDVGIVDSLGGILSAIEFAKDSFPNAKVSFASRKYNLNLDVLGLGILLEENVWLLDPIALQIFLSD